MKRILEAAQVVQHFLVDKDWKFCFIGGLALQRWAIPRLTNDVDLTLLTGFGSEREFIDEILTTFQPRLTDAADFALRTRVLLLEIGGVGIDISLGAMPFEERTIDRSSIWQVTPDIALQTCSAEDLVVHKAFAGRLQDWADVENILRVQTDLDWSYINEQLPPLLELKYDLEAMTKLTELRNSIESE